MQRVAQDHIDIWQLTTRYASCLDRRDWAGLESVFTPEGVMEFAGLGERTGAAAIVQVCAAALEPLDASQHLLGSHVIDVTGDQATSTCYFQAQHVRVDAGDEPNYVVAGTYRDRLVRTPQGWRIAHRTQTVTWTSGNAYVLEHFGS